MVGFFIFGVVMKVSVIESIDAVEASDWNSLARQHNPFLSHEFLAALERNHCVGPHFGWLPRHLIALDSNNRLLGAVPMYLKHNSYGEFVFDWSWADAYARSGLHYYPKLVSSIPYTPATGPRILIGPDRTDTVAIRDALIDYSVEFAKSLNVSSLHWLFPSVQDMDNLRAKGFLTRLDCQFHWVNQHYTNFEHFLQRFTSVKRKKVKQERRRVNEVGIQIEVLHGPEIDLHRWAIFYEFYASTFAQKGGVATFNRAFFEEVGRTMGEQVVLMLARQGASYVAGALCYRGGDILHGRHWGCSEQYNSLHFELCYYQGIEYCITKGLQRFEPGAQGEHKISRGFLPVATRSAHWIAHPQFNRAIEDFLCREQVLMEAQIQQLTAHSPYKTHADSE